jgi:hypothetical protein
MIVLFVSNLGSLYRGTINRSATKTSVTIPLSEATNGNIRSRTLVTDFTVMNIVRWGAFCDYGKVQDLSFLEAVNGRKHIRASISSDARNARNAKFYNLF